MSKAGDELLEAVRDAHEHQGEKDYEVKASTLLAGVIYRIGKAVHAWDTPAEVPDELNIQLIVSQVEARLGFLDVIMQGVDGDNTDMNEESTDGD